MNRLSSTMIGRAAKFVWLTGDVFDQRRMAWFTGDGTASQVRTAMDAYRTDDGGYGYALEPDVKGPTSQPITVMTALTVLDQIGALNQDIARPLCDWLSGVSAADGGVPDLLATISDYPRPSWVEPPTSPAGSLLTTARTAGLLLKHRIDHPWLDGAAEFCRQRIDELTDSHPYEVMSVNVFLDYEADRDHARTASRRLGELVRDRKLVLLDVDHPPTATPPPGYAEAEFHYAHDFVSTPSSLAAEWFSPAELVTSLDHLAAAQQSDGGWQIHYRRWTPGIEQQARPGATVAALLKLRTWDQCSA